MEINHQEQETPVCPVVSPPDPGDSEMQDVQQAVPPPQDHMPVDPPFQAALPIAPPLSPCDEQGGTNEVGLEPSGETVEDLDPLVVVGDWYRIEFFGVTADVDIKAIFQLLMHDGLLGVHAVSVPVSRHEAVFSFRYVLDPDYVEMSFSYQTSPSDLATLLEHAPPHREIGDLRELHPFPPPPGADASLRHYIRYRFLDFYRYPPVVMDRVDFSTKWLLEALDEVDHAVRRRLAMIVNSHMDRFNHNIVPFWVPLYVTGGPYDILVRELAQKAKDSAALGDASVRYSRPSRKCHMEAIGSTESQEWFIQWDSSCSAPTLFLKPNELERWIVCVSSTLLWDRHIKFVAPPNRKPAHSRQLGLGKFLNIFLNLPDRNYFFNNPARKFVKGVFAMRQVVTYRKSQLRVPKRKAFDDPSEEPSSSGAQESSKINATSQEPSYPQINIGRRKVDDEANDEVNDETANMEKSGPPGGNRRNKKFRVIASTPSQPPKNRAYIQLESHPKIPEVEISARVSEIGITSEWNSYFQSALNPNVHLQRLGTHPNARAKDLYQLLSKLNPTTKISPIREWRTAYSRSIGLNGTDIRTPSQERRMGWATRTVQKKGRGFAPVFSMRVKDKGIHGGPTLSTLDKDSN
ncbi:hypothetical protein BS47DRAFT_1357272 [Hydnum rufescens UP504]|uniref:Uncharacterized protein n=1 Tax=Hydnum rufescens UP504 TaxID=1448309 RepID=A0A9P6E2E3_9AGAM|nr:hypothetical protein BS47DRAFT_1357272 [Hydnum rufescens UP504]